MKIILASKSPRRKELLKQIGVDFDTVVSTKEEVITTEVPSEAVIELSKQKALDVFDIITMNHSYENQDIMIIGSDTVVAYEDRILGKPIDKNHAKEMLSFLSGSHHEVYTGVTLLKLVNGHQTIKSFYECTKVFMYPITDEEIIKYIETEEPMDKAGSYGIQGIGGKFIRRIEGDYNNVVGLPIGRLYQEGLKEN